MKINNRCHICLEDYRCSRSIKLCCDAFICKECIIDLINNDFDKCPICKNDLEIGDNCKFNCCIFPYNYFRYKFNKITLLSEYFIIKILVIVFYLFIFYVTGYFIIDREEFKLELWSILLNIVVGSIFYILLLIMCWLSIACCHS